MNSWRTSFFSSAALIRNASDTYTVATPQQGADLHSQPLQSKMLSIRSATAFATVMIFALHANAQTVSKKPIRKPTPAVDVQKPDTPAPQSVSPPAPPRFQPVFFAVSEPVSAYAVNELPKVFAWIEDQMAAVPGKTDRYSTTDERQRYETAVAERMKAIRPIAFISGCQKKYDADQQVFEVKVLLSTVKDSSLKNPNPEALNLRRVTLSRANVKNDSYMAQNAYGAATEVYRSSSDDYAVTFPAGPTYEPKSAFTSGSSPSLPYRYSYNFLSLNVKMAPGEARENDKQIACMSVISLESPYLFKFKENEFPTRDHPFESTTNGFALYGRLDQIAVVHKITGEIYATATRAFQ